jgi:hypothetical protein
MMSITKGKKIMTICLLTVTLGLIILLVFYSEKKEGDPSPYINEIQVTGGWGYELIYNDKILIHQEFIPAIPGKYAFQDRADAQKVGQLALIRLLQGHRPIITIQDLDSLNIKYPELPNTEKY